MRIPCHAHGAHVRSGKKALFDDLPVVADVAASVPLVDQPLGALGVVLHQAEEEIGNVREGRLALVVAHVALEGHEAHRHALDERCDLGVPSSP